MTNHQIGTREQWLKARIELLEAEKELTRRSDELARRRQQLPWVRRITMNAPDTNVDVEPANDICTSPRSAGTKKMFEASRGSATMIATRRETAGGSAGSDYAAALGAADCVCLAAAPTFAIMALHTGVLGVGSLDMLCSEDEQGASGSCTASSDARVTRARPVSCGVPSSQPSNGKELGSNPSAHRPLGVARSVGRSTAVPNTATRRVPGTDPGRAGSGCTRPWVGPPHERGG